MKQEYKDLSLEPTIMNQKGIDLIFHRMAKTRRKWEKYIPVKEKDCLDQFSENWKSLGHDLEESQPW